jgi:hypothetical protein
MRPIFIQLPWILSAGLRFSFMYAAPNFRSRCRVAGKLGLRQAVYLLAQDFVPGVGYLARRFRHAAARVRFAGEPASFFGKQVTGR